MEHSSIEDAEESENEFCFETDHLALRGNKDYCELLKYVAKLEAQKIKALKDIDDLVEAQNQALIDPLKFLQDIKDGNLTFPSRQIIDDLPAIDWSKYDIDSLSDQEDQTVTSVKEDPNTVRGRKFTDNKPETFNQLWSLEEQKRLEELLEIYPEEAIEAKRYKKIADALGTRTQVQVTSRIQKYFAKLAKAGLPIPGRAPRKVSKDKNKSIFLKKSTFFPQLHVPVRMDEMNDTVDSQSTIASSSEIRDSNESLELLKTAKEQRLLDESFPVYQTNTLCVGCQKKGFLGARWTDNAGTDYCTDCIVRLLPNVKLTPIRKPI